MLADRNETFIDEAVVSVGPNATAQVAFTHRFVTSGPKIIHVELIVPDDLPEDNRRSVAVSVIDEIGVLLIDGDPSKEWLKGRDVVCCCDFFPKSKRDVRRHPFDLCGKPNC